MRGGSRGGALSRGVVLSRGAVLSRRTRGRGFGRGPTGVLSITVARRAAVRESTVSAGARERVAAGVVVSRELPCKATVARSSVLHAV